MSKSKVSLEDKVKKDNPEFVSEVASLSVQELDKRLSDLAKGAEDIRDARDADEDYQNVKEQVKEMGAPYRDSLKAVTLKTRYIISLIKEKS